MHIIGGGINISDYWHVGDMRTIQLSAITSGGENHSAQKIVMVIIGINHDDLAVPIGNRTKAAITLQFREMLGKNGGVEPGYHYGNSGQWSSSTRRRWLNNTFINALPTNIQQLLKTVVKKNLANHTNSNAGTSSEDKIFFTSFSEMFGDESYRYYAGNQELEGEQYPYYKSESARAKSVNSEGEVVSNHANYWLRSPSTRASNNWIVVDTTGSPYNFENNNYMGICPAFCL